MLTSTLRNVGGSVMMAIPKSLLDGLGFTVNSKVDVSVDGGRLIVAPRKRPKYTLDELLAQCDPNAPAIDDAWDAAPPVGREEW